MLRMNNFRQVSLLSKQVRRASTEPLKTGTGYYNSLTQNQKYLLYAVGGLSIGYAYYHFYYQPKHRLQKSSKVEIEVPKSDSKKP